MSLADCTDAQTRHWPADKVERRPVADLIPYAQNTRQHPPEQVAQLAASIEQFGWTVPLLVDEDGELIAGHGRLLAAHQLGIEEVPVIVARGWTDEQKRAYRIADNKLAENSLWDDEALRVELADLKGADVELEGLGFSADELDVVFNGWEPDADKTAVEAKLSGLEAVVKVKCGDHPADDVAEVVRRAIEEAGFEGVTVT
jgi:Predicted transcriptional regulators